VERVYASLTFERTRPIAEHLRTVYPDAVIGGTGWKRRLRLEDLVVYGKELGLFASPGVSTLDRLHAARMPVAMSLLLCPRKRG
jgi:hypothetical protein